MNGLSVCQIALEMFAHKIMAAVFERSNMVDNCKKKILAI